jgi:N-methylhydantoinase A
LSRIENRGGADWEAARKEVRQAYFKDAGGTIQLPVYERSLAPVEAPVPGPAVIEQYDSTLVVESGWTARVDSVGQIIVTRD